VFVRDLGTHLLAEFRLGQHVVLAKLRDTVPVFGDATVWLRFAPERTLYYVNEKRVA
jgi:glycerol transport system ATP-binding protein